MLECEFPNSIEKLRALTALGSHFHLEKSV